MLLAYQPVGPAVGRLLRLAQTFPGVTFRAVVDDEAAARALSAAFAGAERTIDLLVDLDVGMHRTGIAPEPGAAALPPAGRRCPASLPAGCTPTTATCAIPTWRCGAPRPTRPSPRCATLRDALQADGLPVPRVVVGGTPTLPCHATRDEPDLELSPGTVVFWDAGYTAGLPDMDFLSAALVLTRVVSKPGGNRVCLDLGHKAVASEMPHPRVVLLQPQASGLAGLRAADAGLQAPRPPSSGTARSTSCSRRRRRRRCTSATCSTACRGTCARPSPPRPGRGRPRRPRGGSLARHGARANDHGLAMLLALAVARHRRPRRADRPRADARVSGADDRVAGAGARRGPGAGGRRHRVPARRRQHARVHRGRHRAGHVCRRAAGRIGRRLGRRARGGGCRRRALAAAGRSRRWASSSACRSSSASGSSCSSPSSSGWPPPPAGRC